MTKPAATSILLVDDDPSFAEVTADMLLEQDDSLIIETATGVAEGIDILTKNGFDCVVSDYHMPEKTGIEFLNKVREEYPHLPFILYTGKGSESVAGDAISAGVTDYVQKGTGSNQYTILANRIHNAVERRHQRERAQATRDRLRQIINIIPQLIFVKDESGTFLLVNEATADAYGTTVDNLEGITDADIAKSEAEADHFYADDQAVIEAGEPKFIPEEELTTADGETRLLETRKIPYDPVETDGNAVLGISTNITQRKKREQELQEKNTVLRTVVESLPMGIIVENAERDVLIANDKMGETLGVPVTGDELIGRDCTVAAEDVKSLFTHPDEFISDITERINQRKPVQAEELELADGRILERDYVPYTLSEREASLWLYRDVTERKHRRQKIERTSQFLQKAQRVGQIGGWRFDLRSETLQWTEEVYRIHGVTKDTEMTLMDSIDLYHPDDRDQLREAVDRLIAEGEPYEQEVRIGTGDTDVCWVCVQGEPEYEDTEFVGIQGIVQDITDRKKRQKELEQQNDQLNNFARVVSHDLRNPLAIAQGRTELLQQRASSDSQADLDTIMTALERIESIIEDTLNLVKQGKAIGQVSSVLVSRLVKECWDGVATAEATLEITDKFTICGDSMRLRHVFENLFRNAIEHGGDSVTVRVGRTGEDGFYIEDDGAGIPPGDRQEVFNIGHTSTTDGTGLGLTIVKRIAVAHGWNVHITDGQDGGARFKFTSVDMETS